MQGSGQIECCARGGNCCPEDGLCGWGTSSAGRNGRSRACAAAPGSGFGREQKGEGEETGANGKPTLPRWPGRARGTEQRAGRRAQPSTKRVPGTSVEGKSLPA